MIRGLAKVLSTGVMKQLDGKADPDQQVTEQDVQQPPKLARLLTDVLRDLARLKRRPYLRRIDYEDIAVTAGGSVTLAHRFNARVRWWVVDWVPSVSGVAPVFERTVATTDANTLILKAGNSGTATFRVEESG